MDHGIRTHLGSEHPQVSFANLADRPLDGSFMLRLLASATNNDFVAEVPEPHGAALALAGLAVIGGCMRRRSRRSGSSAGV